MNDEQKFPALKSWCETPMGNGQITDGPQKSIETGEQWYVTFAQIVDGVGKGKWFPKTQINPLVR